MSSARQPRSIAALRLRASAVLGAALLSLPACASQTPLLAADGHGNYVFGTVLRSYERGGAADTRLRSRARSFCGGEDRFALRVLYGPPGETPPLVFEPHPTRNNFRGDIVEYGMVGCRGGGPDGDAAKGVPQVRVLQGYETLSDDTPAVPPAGVEVIDHKDQRSWPPSAIESIETHLKPPFKASQIDVRLTPDYPTKADPDRLLGFFDVGVLEGDDEARAIGGRHGANLLVKEGSAGVYLAFHISHAYPPVDQAIAMLGLPKGWTSVSSATFGDPAQDGSIEIAGVVGKCYAIAGAMAPDATVKVKAPRLIRSWEGSLGVFYPPELPGHSAFKGRSFLSVFGCPATPSKLGLKVGWREAGGQGGYQLFVYSRAATASELSELKLFATQQKCRECRTDRLSCLAAAGVTESACTTALRSAAPPSVGGLRLDGYH